MSFHGSLVSGLLSSAPHRDLPAHVVVRQDAAWTSLISPIAISDPVTAQFLTSLLPFLVAGITPAQKGKLQMGVCADVAPWWVLGAFTRL